MNSVLRVMPRDIEALDLLYQFHFATIEDMRLAVYHNRNVTQRRLQGLTQMGLINELGITLENKGRPTKVYFLNRSRRNKLTEIIGRELAMVNLEKQSGIQDQNLLHLLGTNRFIARLMASAKQQDLQLRFYGEYHKVCDQNSSHPATQDEVTDPMNKGRRVRYRRDAIACLSSGKTSALFEIEYDRGTEVIHSPSKRAVSLYRKTTIFLQSIEEERFKKFSGNRYFDSTFKVSRLLIITTTNQRLAHIVSAVSDLKTKGIVFLTSEERLKTASPVGEVWEVLDQSGKPRTKSLVTNHGR